MNSSVYWHLKDRSPRLEPLSGNVTSEVVVVGGGMAGLTCAHELVTRGIDVTLVERSFCGAGASGKTSGFVTPDSELELSDLVARYGPAQGQMLWEFARSGLERIRYTIETFGINCDYQVQDSLFVARSPGAFRDAVELEHKVQAALGYQTSIYDRIALTAIFGSRAAHGGVRYGGTFGMDSYAYCRALRDEIRRQGARIYEDTPVIRLTGSGVETPKGAVAARAVAVLADRCLPDLGLATSAVYHVQTFLAVSRILGEKDIRSIFPQDRLMVWDTDLLYHYFRITGDGRLLLGGADLCSMYARRESRSTRRAARKLSRHVARNFPGLRIEFEHLWPGLIGVSKDFAPIVGTHRAFPSVHFAGVAAGLPWAAALGEYLAHKITNGRRELDELLSPERPFAISPRLQRLVSKPLAFALSHGASKYLERPRHDLTGGALR